MRHRLVGFAGPVGVGKNFVANQFENTLLALGGFGIIEQGAFADALKEYCIDILGIDRELVYGSQEQKNTLTEYRWSNMPYHIKFGKEDEDISLQISHQTKNHPLKEFMTVREVLQFAGTELHRNTWDQDIWVKALMRRIDKFQKQFVEVSSFFLVTDVRFPNEAQAILARGGTVYLIHRDGFKASANHVSETHFDQIRQMPGVEPFANHTREQVLADINNLLSKEWE